MTDVRSSSRAAHLRTCLISLAEAASVQALWLAALCLTLTPGLATSQAIRFDRVILSSRDSAAHVFTSNYAGTVDSLRLVVRDSTSFAKIWIQLDSFDRKSAAPPPVDFARQDVVIASLGASGVLGPFIWIDTVGISRHQRIIVVRRFVLPSYCGLFGLAHNASRPTDVAVIPRDSVDATRFVERVTVLPYCHSPTAGAPRPQRRP